MKYIKLEIGKTYKRKGEDGDFHDRHVLGVEGWHVHYIQIETQKRGMCSKAHFKRFMVLPEFQNGL